MRASRTLLICILTTSLTGCDQFGDKHEIVRAGNQTFLLNKVTGETKVIEGTQLIPVIAPFKEPDEALVRQAKAWPDQAIRQLGNIKLTVRTKYRDGNMLYSITAAPFAGKLEREYSPAPGGVDYLRQPTFFVDLYDADGFRTGADIELRVRGATRIVDEKDEVRSLIWTGTQPMSIDTYRAVTNQNARWAGFKDGPEPDAK